MRDFDWDSWFVWRPWALPAFGFVAVSGVSILTYFYLDATQPERERAMRANCASFCDGGSFMLHRSGDCVCVITPEDVR